MKSGDFLLLQMGHNDGGDLGGAKPRGDLKGIGDDTQDVAQTTGPYAGKIETIHTFGWYLRKMIDDAKAKGVHPILLTPTIRNIWKAPDGSPCGAATQPACPAGAHIERDMGYNDWVRQVAAQEQIPVLELGTIEADASKPSAPKRPRRSSPGTTPTPAPKAPTSSRNALPPPSAPPAPRSPRFLETLAAQTATTPRNHQGSVAKSSKL